MSAVSVLFSGEYGFSLDCEDFNFDGGDCQTTSESTMSVSSSTSYSTESTYSSSMSTYSSSMSTASSTGSTTPDLCKTFHDCDGVCGDGFGANVNWLGDGICDDGSAYTPQYSDANHECLCVWRVHDLCCVAVETIPVVVVVVVAALAVVLASVCEATDDSVRCLFKNLCLLPQSTV